MYELTKTEIKRKISSFHRHMLKFPSAEAQKKVIKL